MESIKRDFKSYEYKDITVPEEKASLYLDCYENFGWIQDEKFPYRNRGTKLTFRLKRDRKIINKMELTRLQHHFESCIIELNRYNQEKESEAIGKSIFLGLVGTVFIAGATFAVTAEPPIIWLTILLGIPGLIGWALPPIVYYRLKDKKEIAIQPMIDEKYEEIFDICEKGYFLLH